MQRPRRIYLNADVIAIRKILQVEVEVQRWYLRIGEEQRDVRLDRELIKRLQKKIFPSFIVTAMLAVFLNQLLDELIRLPESRILPPALIVTMHHRLEDLLRTLQQFILAVSHLLKPF